MATITLEVHYGGKLMFSPSICYTGGTKEVIENYDPDCITVTDIIAFLKKSGYNSHNGLWCKFGDEDMNSICPLENDKDVVQILKKLLRKTSAVLQVYVDHKSENEEVELNLGELHDVGLILSGANNYDTIGEGGQSEDEEVDLTGCDFLDSEADQPDLFFDKGNIGVEIDVNEWITRNIGAIPTIPNTDGIPITDGAQWDGNAQSEYGDSDELVSLDGSADEGSIKKPRYKTFNEKIDFNRPINLHVGLKFGNFKIYRDALKQYAIENGIDFKYIKNEAARITVVCKKECGWKIHASKTHNGQAFQIKSFYGKDHNCGWVRENKKVNSSWLANKYIENIRDQPDWKVTAFVNQVQRDHNVSVSRSQTYRAKKKAIEKIEGSHAEQFSRLWDYCLAVREGNPGSTLKLKLEDGRFTRMYVCLDACKKGFLAVCRPIICVDGCFLKGSFGGQLLSAIGKDANENMYPIAYAIVESECRSSWAWFLDLLFDDIGSPHEKGWVIMSDMQKGLEQLLEHKGYDRRICVRHLYANFKAKFKGQSLKDELWNACQATTKHEFDRHMNLLKELDQDAYNYLSNKDPKLWSKHAFTTRTKCDIVQNNIAETFNSFILEARDKLIITLCEIIRRMFMKRYTVKKEGMENYQGPICPRIQAKLERAKEQSKNFICYMVGDGRFEVESPWKREVVNLHGKSCTCNRWDLTGIPCGHAVAAIYMMRDIPEDYVHQCYSKDAFLQAYSNVVGPVPSDVYWTKTNYTKILPPKYKKAPGRPKKVRRKATDEPKNPFLLRKDGSTLKCGNCGALGHNARGCKGPINPTRKIYKKGSKKMAQPPQRTEASHDIPMMSQPRTTQSTQASTQGDRANAI